jgi:hypothetical protein
MLGKEPFIMVPGSFDKKVNRHGRKRSYLSLSYPKSFKIMVFPPKRLWG